jgi:hypothetical protein
LYTLPIWDVHFKVPLYLPLYSLKISSSPMMEPVE